MILFLYIVCGLMVFMVLVVIANWWLDELDKKNGFVSSRAVPTVPSSAPLHPSIDPYLSELREYLLRPPLPHGPGEMAERVYTHLNQWVNIHLTDDALHTVDLESELLIEPSPRFVDMSRNEALPPPGYLENLMKEEQ